MAATTATLLPLAAYATTTSLEDIQIGKASWTSLGTSSSNEMQLSSSTFSNDYDSAYLPASFCTYLVRFLIQFDSGVQSWWEHLEHDTSLLSTSRKDQYLGQAFGKFAASLQESLRPKQQQQDHSTLLEHLWETYNHSNPDVVRHLGILAALLPPHQQPNGDLRRRLLQTKTTTTTTTTTLLPPEMGQSSSENWREDLGSLLPSFYHVVVAPAGDTSKSILRLSSSPSSSSSSSSILTISPPLPIMASVGVGDENGTDNDRRYGDSMTSTVFGPLSSSRLTRELPTYSPSIYTLLGVSGATGCALTHSLVIPLDVLKTKAQADPEGYSNLLEASNKLLKEEGISGLLTGAQATVVGYLWYGLSVYPGYTFFKRCLSGSPWAVAHENDIALLAGALASVIASLGLTPLEAARIRVVTDPVRYRPLGLTGTLQVLAEERTLYAGLPSLLTRQIIFGSVKFLAFERACDAIYSIAPSLGDQTWTALGVSLMAGGFSGVLSSIVSQPADSILTYVAQTKEEDTGKKNTNNKNGGNNDIFISARTMIERGGMSALFQGLGSRCIWAGSIIAGQFLLYDVFRTFFGVTTNDLSQVWQVEI